MDDADKRRVAGIVRGNLPKRLNRSFMQFCSLEVAEGEEVLKSNGASERIPLMGRDISACFEPFICGSNTGRAPERARSAFYLCTPPRCGLTKSSIGGIGNWFVGRDQME